MYCRKAVLGRCHRASGGPWHLGGRDSQGTSTSVANVNQLQGDALRFQAIALCRAVWRLGLVRIGCARPSAEPLRGHWLEASVVDQTPPRDPGSGPIGSSGTVSQPVTAGGLGDTPGPSAPPGTRTCVSRADRRPVGHRWVNAARGASSWADALGVSLHPSELSSSQTRRTGAHVASHE